MFQSQFRAVLAVCPRASLSLPPFAPLEDGVMTKAAGSLRFSEDDTSFTAKHLHPDTETVLLHTAARRMSHTRLFKYSLGTAQGY